MLDIHSKAMIEKELRKKFVVVTTAMMIAIFGTIFIVNEIYLSHMMKQDIIAIIELISGSGLFTGEDEIDEEEFFEELVQESPIVGIILDSEGNELSRRIVGKGYNASEITADMVNTMYKSDGNEHLISKYIYTKKELNNGNILLVIIPNEVSGNGWMVTVETVLLAVIAVFVLVLASFYLSRLVTDPAKKAIEREKRFISDASHELKTPLSAISINAQALELNSESSIYVRNILSESERMNRLIDRLLTLSKLEEDSIKEFDQFSLSQIVQEMLLTFETIAYECKCELNYSIEDGLLQYGNADEIRQLTAILLDNAIKNNDNNYPVEFICCRSAEGNIIEVSNTGIGIDEESIKHVFDRFYTTDQSRNDSSFGLGLAIAKAIVERHDGQISVSSVRLDNSEKRETVFTVVI